MVSKNGKKICYGCGIDGLQKNGLTEIVVRIFMILS